MSNPGVQITATLIGSGDPYAPDSQHHIVTFSDGYKLALWNDSGGNTQYATRTTGGVWSGQTAVGSTAAVMPPAHFVGQIADTIYLWCIPTAAPTTLTCTILPWTAGSHTMGGTSTATSAANGGFVNLISASMMDGAWDATNSVWHMAAAGIRSSDTVLYDAVVTQSGTTVTRVYQYTATTAPSPKRLHVLLNSTNYYRTYADTSTGKTSVFVSAIPAGGQHATTIGYGETAYGTGCDHAAVFDSTNKLWLILYKQSTGQVLAIQRTGTNTYSAVTPLYTNTAAGSLTFPAVCYNGSTGDLNVVFESKSNQANGEIYLVQRKSGIWQGALSLIGGDAGGYLYASVGATTDSNQVTDVLYRVGSSSYSLYYFGNSATVAPSAPTPIAPSGNTLGSGANPTPAFSWTYNTASPGDGQGAYEIQVVRTSDSHVMWDSGEVTSTSSSGIVYGATSNAGDGNYVAPANLSYAVQYGWKVRTWDAGGAGVGAWSTLTTFTAYHAIVPELLSVTCGGTTSTGTASSTLASNTAINATSLTVQTGAGASFTSGDSIAVGVSPNIDVVAISSIAGDTFTVPAMAHAHSSTDPVVQVSPNTVTITGPTLSATFSFTQADSDQCNAYSLAVLQLDGVTRVASTGQQSVAGFSAGTSQATINLTASGMVNGQSYLLQVTAWDATTGLSAGSATWTLVNAWTLPPAISGFTTTVDTTNGVVVLSWTNPGGIASTSVFYRTSGATAWTALSTGSLRTSITVYAPLNVAWDYGIQTVNASGVPSTMSTSVNVMLTPKLGAYGCWLNDTTQPAVVLAALGAIDSTDYGPATLWTHNEDILEFVPMGRKKLISSFGLADYWTTKSTVWWIPASDAVMGGNTLSTTVLANLQSMAQTHNLLLYRDILGTIRFVTMRNYQPQVADVINAKVTYDLSEADTTLTVLVV